MNANKFFLALLLGAASIMGAWAQYTPKREFFCDPAKYQYRLKSYQHFGQVVTFNYDERGYLSSREVVNGNGTLESKTLYYYDEKGYFIRRDYYGRPRVSTGEFDIVSQRDEYTRNEKGQIISFSVSQLLGEDIDDETLTKTREGKITYNEKGLESEATFTAGIEGTADWAPFRKCKVEYDAQGRIKKLNQVSYPGEEEVLMDEVFEYNDRGQITKINHNSYTAGTGGELVYQYDEEGNLTESGNIDFPNVYSYEKKDLKGDKTFFPVAPVAMGLYSELRNTFVLALGFPVFYTLSATAPTKELIKGSDDGDETEGVFVYESVPMSNILIPSSENNLKPTVEGGHLSVVLPNELMGQLYYLCNAEGVLLQRGVISSENLALEVNNLPHGIYLLKAGSQNAKVLL